MIEQFLVPAQLASPDQIRYDRILVYGAAGAAYNFAAYSNKLSKTGETWQFSKASRTIYLGIIAGAIVAVMEPGATGENFEQAMFAAIPIADQVLNALGNLRQQIQHNQFSEWGDGDWFFDGTTPAADPDPDPENGDETASGDTTTDADAETEVVADTSGDDDMMADDPYADAYSMDDDMPAESVTGEELDRDMDMDDTESDMSMGTPHAPDCDCDCTCTCGESMGMDDDPPTADTAADEPPHDYLEP